jgi:hypothetical protein
VASTTRDAMRRRRLGRMAASTDTRSFGLDRYLPEDVRTILEERFWHAVEEKANDIEAFMARGSCDRDRFRFEASTEGTRGNKPSPLADSNRRPPPYHGGALPTELRGRAAHCRRSPLPLDLSRRGAAIAGLRPAYGR